MYGSWSWILSILANTWFSLENRIFLTVSNSCLILKNFIPSWNKAKWDFLEQPWGVALCSRAWQTKDLDASLKELLPRFHWTTCEAYIDNLEARGPKRKTLFIFKVIAYLQPEKLNIFCQDRFSRPWKGCYKGMYGRWSWDFEHFGKHLIFTWKPNFLDCIQ